MKNFTKILLTIACCISGGHQMLGDDEVVTGKYWFDNNSNFTTFSPGQFDISTDQLPDGLHILNAFVVKDGISSATASRWFVKSRSLSSASSSNVHLSIDGRPFDVIKCTPNGDVASLNVDMTGVREGIHQIDAMVDINGTVSSTASSWFVKSLFLRPGEKYTTTLFLDGMPWNSFESQASSNGLMSLMLDMNSVSLGLHSLKVQVVSPTGVATSIKETMFMRMPSMEQLATLRGYYVIDNSIRGDLETVMDGNTFHIDVDASALTSGLHSVSVYLSGVVGLTTPVKTAWFVKIPNGGEGVKSYEYWLNDNYEEAKKATLDKVANPFSLVTLMDIAAEPFRSSRYTFAIENGTPVVYAKNDLQMRFSDSEGRISMSSKPFTDVRIKHTVDDISPITTEQTEYKIPSIADNEIKWFSFNAEAGDSINIRLNKGAMYEIWCPDTKELISASGAESMVNNGIGITQTGTYYLAVHDPSGTSWSNPIVYFNHIPRFALLSNTPTKASASGFLVIDIDGNGFDQLKSVYLENNGHLTDAAMTLIRDRYRMSLVYDLDGANIQPGTYNLVAKFDDNGVEVSCIKSEAIQFIEKGRANITTEIITPRIIGTPYQFYVDVTNNSDQSAWFVPVNIAIAEPENGVGVELMDIYLDKGDSDEMDPIYISTDNLLGTNQSGVMMPFFIPYIGPNETKRFTLGFYSGPHEHVKVYAWNGDAWSDEFEDIFSPGFNEDEIINRDLYETNILTAKDLIHYEYLTAMDEISSAGLRPSLSVMDCAETVRYSTRHLVLSSFVNMFKTLAARDENACFLLGIDMTYHPLSYNWTTSGSSKNVLTYYKIKITIIRKGKGGDKSNSSVPKKPTIPTPSPKSAVVDCYQSGDPNDMTGYISPSGDNYIGLDVKRVNYTIEFENDPEIANASASTIKVENTVDGKTLDLASFKPLTLRIGDKETDLPAEHHFVKTLDMRPAINAVAELTFDYDAESGEASWSLRSLDPMTMETTKYMDDGILPVNDDSGRGIGYLTYSINLNPGLADGTEISNSATIVFDDNEPISTPVWTNVTDYVKPSAKIVSQVSSDDNKSVNFVVEGSDNRSGIWYYDLYMRQSGAKGWTLVRSQIEEDEFTYESTVEIGGASFTVIATDKAGNRQDNSLLVSLPGDADGNGKVDANDVVVTYNFYTGNSTSINAVNADVTLDGVIDAQDATYMINMYVDKAQAKSRKRIIKSRK
ncbi:MAG: dockerin type I repeat-containing protein [Lachnoclostridium sp.]|nr:dockerin type I repeat-containing protein [Lachnoclostridium sp.]